jgi:hypothetical protein
MNKIREVAMHVHEEDGYINSMLFPNAQPVHIFSGNDQRNNKRVHEVYIVDIL